MFSDAKNHDANEISKKSSRKRKNTNMTLQKSPIVGMAFSNLAIYNYLYYILVCNFTLDEL